MDPISLFVFFFRYLFKELPRTIIYVGLAGSIGWMIVKYSDAGAIENMSLKTSPTAFFVVAAIMLLGSIGAAWQGHNLRHEGWPLKWTWGSFVLVSYDQIKASPKIELFNGMVENISDSPVRIEEMTLVAGQTSKSFNVLLNDRFGKYLEAEQFEDIPAHSDRIDFRALFKSETEAIFESDYWSQVGTLEFVARYAGREYRRKFSRKEIAAEIDRVKPKTQLPYPAIKNAK